jgi:hypothetical protein
MAAADDPNGGQEVMTVHREIRLLDLEPNPFRDLQAFGLDAARVKRLEASITETGFWANMQARPHPTKRGKYQIPNGHHRVAAAIAVLGANHRQSVEVIECGDLEMLQRMAAENAEEFGAMPAHLVQCVEQSVALLAKMFERVPTLGKPSTAKSDSGRRKARSATQTGKTTRLSGADPHDLETLRRLYGSENNYQKARAAGRPGATVLVEFLRGAFDNNAVRTALRAYEAALKAGVPVTQLVDTVENVHQLNILSRSVSGKAAAHLSASDMGETLTRTKTALQDAKRGVGRAAGRRKLGHIAAHVMREVAHEQGNAAAERAALMEELAGLMKDIPLDLGHGVMRFRRLVDRARAANLTSLEDRRLFGGFYQIIENLLGAFAIFYESELPAISTKHRATMVALLARLHRAIDVELPALAQEAAS